MVVHIRAGVYRLTRSLELSEGDSGREFFVLVEGVAEVRRKGRKVSTMKPGDFFGEIALVSDRPRTATVTVAAPGRVLVMTDRAFRELMQRMPSIQLKVLAAVVDRFAYLNVGLGIVLAFIGVKMLIAGVYKSPITTSLLVVASVLLGSVLLSLARPPKQLKPPGETSIRQSPLITSAPDE